MKKERERYTKEPTAKQRKQAVEDFEWTRNMAEAKAYQKLSMERPLTAEELRKYKAVCGKLGIHV